VPEGIPAAIILAESRAARTSSRACAPWVRFRIGRHLLYHPARQCELVLAIARADGIEVGSGKGVAKTGHQNQKHIFVINDTIAILELFTALLGDEGYRVTTDGFTVEMVELLKRVKAERPDLLVLDFLIQDEGKGWQFLQMLKMDRETRNIPVVVCTAAVKLVEDLQPHLDAMGVGVVLKPFDIEVLLAEIDKMWRTQNRG
jgi:CheY-like chemotaxis protein